MALSRSADGAVVLVPEPLREPVAHRRGHDCGPPSHERSRVRRGGPPARRPLARSIWTGVTQTAWRIVIEAAAAGAFEPVITDEIEAEYRDVLARDKLRRAAPRPARFGSLRASWKPSPQSPSGSSRRRTCAPWRRTRTTTSTSRQLGGGADYVVTLDRRHMLAL